jgi:hypothetical protein
VTDPDASSAFLTFCYRRLLIGTDIPVEATFKGSVCGRSVQDAALLLPISEMGTAGDAQKEPTMMRVGATTFFATLAFRPQ